MRTQLDEFVAEQLDHTRRFKRVDVEADLDRMLEFQQRRQPARDDGAGVADDHKHARILVLQSYMVTRDLYRSRREQVC